MDYFIDITIKPDAEMRENLLLNKVYTKLHKGLCTLKASDIGVSFPKQRIVLGRVLRLHSTERRLTELQALNWLGGLVGYCEVSHPMKVPEKCPYRNVSRKQSTMTSSKLRRLTHRGSITAEKAKEYKAKMFSKGLSEPYLELESHSNGRRHRRYIQQGVLTSEAITGEFDQFGLSKTATVPWF